VNLRKDHYCVCDVAPRRATDRAGVRFPNSRPRALAVPATGPRAATPRLNVDRKMAVCFFFGIFFLTKKKKKKKSPGTTHITYVR